MVVGGSTRDEVRGNTTFNNAQGFPAGGSRHPHLRGCLEHVVDGNVTHDNEDSGIEILPRINNNLINNNVSYNNGDHGIDNYSSTGEPDHHRTAWTRT